MVNDYTNSSLPWWKDLLMVISLVTAVGLHLAIVSLHFAMPEGETQTSKEIALAVSLAKEPVDDADFLAQQDQQGSGEFKQTHRMTSDAPAPMDITGQGQQALDSLEQRAQQQQMNFQEKVLMTVLSWQKQAEQDQREKQVNQVDSTYQARAAMIASLEAQYHQRQQNFSRMQRVKTVNGIQAKKDATAPYLEKFRDKVENYGNQHYPAEAKQRRLFGEVRLMVVLNSKGGIRALHLLQSSGYDILDEAAKNSVRRAAPFGRFDPAMKEISELRIVRTWRFDPIDAEFVVN